MFVCRNDCSFQNTSKFYKIKLLQISKHFQKQKKSKADPKSTDFSVKIKYPNNSIASRLFAALVVAANDLQ